MGEDASYGEEFLKTEYEMLNEWARHAEDVAHRIFNFYVSVLTATLGGLFVLLQLLASSSLIIGAGMCALLFLLGVVFYDSLISVNVRSAYYRAGMQVIQDHFRRYDAVRKSLVQFPIAFSEDGSKIKNSIGDQLTLVNFSFPGGNQQPLMAGINSLLLGGLIPCVVWSIGGVGFQLFGVLAAAALAVAVSLVAHSRLTQVVVRRNMKALAAMVDLHSKLQDEDQPKRTQEKKKRAGKASDSVQPPPAK